MRKHLKAFMVGVLVFTLFMQPAFSLTNNREVQFDGTESYGIEGEAVPGELIVTIEAEQKSRNPHTNRGQSVRNHVDRFKEQGLVVRDSVSRSKNHQQEFAVQRFTDQFEEKMVKDTGYTYLIEYDTTKSGWEYAKIDVRRLLEEKGLTVKSIEPNYRVQSLQLEKNSVHSNQKWNYEMINLEGAWNTTKGSRDVLIAVLDTGIDYNHESLKNFVAKDLGKNFTNTGSEQDTMDRNGHGTHVAGIIASYNKVSGVMQNASLLPVKVISDEGSGSHFGIIQGIYYAVEQGADVINMSIGGANNNSSYEDAVNFAKKNGVVVVAAAGNDSEAVLRYPAKYDSTISVGAIDKDGQRSAFSNYGEGLDFMAPGRSIYSTIHGNRYAHYSGTSMAAPHVAGIVGLMKAIQPEITVDEIKKMLQETAAYTKGVNQWQYGYGLVNAEEAVKAIAHSEKEAENYESSTVHHTKRIAGTNRYLTAYEIAKKNTTNSDTVILVRGDSINGAPQVVDGLTASGLAGAKNARILLTQPDRLTIATREALLRLMPKRVIIVGGDGAVGPEVVKALKDLEAQGLDLEIQRISGSNRFATAAEVALEIAAARENTAIIVNGTSEVDSLVAGPLAYQGYPILMVNNGRGEIPAATLQAIEALGIEKLLIVGGYGVVSQDLEDQLNRLNGVKVEARYGGANRVETSIMVSEHEAFEGNHQFSLVNGLSYVDAVGASTLKVPVIYFIPKQGITQALETFIIEKEDFRGIGGSSVVSHEILENVLLMIGN